MNRLRGLLKNKRVLAGAAVVVGVAGAVALKRRGGASSPDGELAAGTSSFRGAAGGGGGGVGGGYDSTATDLAGELSAYGQAQQNALEAFGGQLSTTLDALRSPTVPAPSGHGVGGTSPTTPTTPVTPRKPAPKPKHKVAPPKHTPAPAPKPKRITIRRGDTLTSIARSNHTTVSALANANNIKNPNLIIAGKTLKVPAPRKRK